MKKSPILAGVAAVLLFAFATGANAGTLTIGYGPSFLPNRSFIHNSIDAELRHNPAGLIGDVVRLYGDSIVAPAAEYPRILIGGDFSANANDLFSVVYNFTVNLKSPDPITLTLGAQTIIGGAQQTFKTLITINPGFGHYQGQINGPLFALATSGTWNGRLFFDLTTPSASGPGHRRRDHLFLDLKYVDFQLVAVPEPSSLVSLALGLGLVGFLALRRRQVA